MNVRKENESRGKMRPINEEFDEERGSIDSDILLEVRQVIEDFHKLSHRSSRSRLGGRKGWNE